MRSFKTQNERKSPIYRDQMIYIHNGQIYKDRALDDKQVC